MHTYPMKRAEKAERIAVLLEELFPEPPVPLDHTDAFSLLVAVLLSAQCTDDRVNLVTPALFAAAPTPKAMRDLGEAKILELIRSCGLAPTKAKNIKRLSEILCDDYDGNVPETLEELETLPGVGHKTAAVVVSQFFGVPAFPVDTHIFRLARRWGLSRGKTVEAVEADLKKLFAPETWRDVHLQIIFFGRKFCPARGHDPEVCPICSWSGVKSVLAAEAKPKAKKSKASPRKSSKKKASELRA